MGCVALPLKTVRPDHTLDAQAHSSSQSLTWGKFSLAFSITLMAAKMGVYFMTGSVAVLSDAIESVINIATSGFAIYAVWLSSLPRDREHPYGHGRVEYLAEAIEGVAICVAGLAILLVAFSRSSRHETIDATPLGIGLVALIAGVTYVAGTLIVRAGKRHASPAIAADGAHIRADAITTIGAFAGLLLVYITGLQWMDQAVAALLGAWLVWSGGRILFSAAGSLMDEADPALLDTLGGVFEAVRQPGWVAPHLTRVHRLGQTIHVDMHMVFPRYWSLERAHDASKALEHALEIECGADADLMLHMEACTPVSCTYCDVSECPVRQTPFTGLHRWTGDYIAAPFRHGGKHDPSATT